MFFRLPSATSSTISNTMRDADPETGLELPLRKLPPATITTTTTTTSTTTPLPPPKPHRKWTTFSPATPTKSKPAPTWSSYASPTPAHATTSVSSTLSPPTFIPKFSRLRQRSLLATASLLRAAEHELGVLDTAIESSVSLATGATDIPALKDQRTELLAKTRELLASFDADVAADVARMQLEDSVYAAGRGVSVVHFTMRGSGSAGDNEQEEEQSEEEEEWMMLATASGPTCATIVETTTSDDRTALLPGEVNELKRFEASAAAAGSSKCISTVSYRRRKTTPELRPGSYVLSPQGTVVRNDLAISRWLKVIWAVGAILALFFGVGMIASTQRFSPVFLKTYYIVAIFWALISSGLLAWYTGVFGGGAKDKVGMFLASLALWLVVIQIGQSRITLQVQHVL